MLKLARFDRSVGMLHIASDFGESHVYSWPRPRAEVQSRFDVGTDRPVMNPRRGLAPVGWARSGDVAPPQLGLTFGEPVWEAHRAYWLSYPGEQLRRLCRYTTHGLHVAQLLAAGGAWLVDECPVLAFDAALRRPGDHSELVRLPLKELLHRFRYPDLPESELLDILRKVTPACLSPRTLECFKGMLQYPRVIELYQNLPRINAPMIDLVAAEIAFRPSWELLYELVLPENDLLDGVAVSIAYVVRRWDPHFSGSVSIDDLDELDEYEAILEEQSPSLPPPPVPGTRDIIPLTSVSALREEASRMANCASRPHIIRAAKRRQLAFYRMLAPERATLSVHRAADGWRLDEIRLADNQEANEPTRAAAELWLLENKACAGPLEPCLTHSSKQC